MIGWGLCEVLLQYHVCLRQDIWLTFNFSASFFMKWGGNTTSLVLVDESAVGCISDCCMAGGGVGREPRPQSQAIGLAPVAFDP